MLGRVARGEGMGLRVSVPVAQRKYLGGGGENFSMFCHDGAGDDG